jgi:hypothetical protein
MTRARKAPFAIGDRVTSTFHEGEEKIVRRITMIERADHVETGWIASADGGETCPACGVPGGYSITGVSAWWFKKVPS